MLEKKSYFLFVLLIFAFHSLFSDESFSRSQILNAIQKIDQLVIEGREKLPVPGVALAIVFNDETLFLKGYGVRESGKMDPVNINTVFQLASVSKPITSSVLAAVVAEGHIRWDSPIISLDPSFKLSDPWVTRHVTIADLLSHRSGLYDHAGDLLEDLGYDEKNIIHQLRYIPRLNPFRASYAYTNFGFSEAAFSVANTLNTKWAVLAKEKLFSPLRMRNASYAFKDYQNAANKAVSHKIKDAVAYPLYVRNPDPQAPAGGASMSIKDLSKWMIFSLRGGVYKGRRVVSKRALLETQNPYIVSSLDVVEDKISFYGLGWGIKYDEHGHKVLSHSGAFSLGVRSQLLLIPELNIGIAVLCNSSPHAFPEAITQSFLDILYTGKLQKDWLPLMSNKFIETLEGENREYVKPVEYVPNIELNRYMGGYYNDFFGEVKIVKEQDQLSLIIGPKGFRYPLTHHNKDTFIMKTDGENSVNETKVIFDFTPKGLTKRLTIDYLNNHGLGVFLPIHEEN